MMDNRKTLERLFRDGGIDLARGSVFDVVPPPLPPSFDFDRFEGMMLGLAVGDALGNTTESMNPGERARAYGTVLDYLPNRHAGGRAVGLPTDDTQLAFRTLEQMLEDGGRLVPERVADRFVNGGRVFGMGRATREFAARYRAGIPWDRAGVKSSGNGTIMRIAPVVYPHLRRPSPALWADAALLAMATHNDSGAIASCVAFTAILWDLLGMEKAPDPGWWADRFVDVARELEIDAGYRSRSPDHEDFQGPIWKFVDSNARAALREGIPAREACDRWYSGAYMLETMPSALHILALHAADPEEAIVRAVNDTRDNDSIAAVVGAAVGALHGKGAIPRRWLDALPGRTGAEDDGKVYEILRKARDAWGGEGSPDGSSGPAARGRGVGDRGVTGRPSGKFHVVFSHGKESGPAGTKIAALTEVAEAAGARVSSVDYRDLPDPEARVERLRAFPFAPGEVPVLVGSSMGAYVAAVASRHVRPAGLFLVAPAFYLPSYADREPAPFAGSVEVVHAWDDEVVPVELALRWSRKHDVPCHLLPGDHSLVARLPALMRLFAAFLEGLPPATG